MIDDSITEFKIEDNQVKMNMESDEPDEPEYDGDNVKMSVDQQSHGEQSTTDDNENVNKDCDKEITKVRLILEQTDRMMEESYNEPDENTISQNDIPQKVTPQQIQSARGTTTRTRSQSKTHMISLRYLNDTSQSLTLFAGPSQCHLTEIIKPIDPRANSPKMNEAKYAEIRDLGNRGTFRAVLRAEMPDSTNLITARYDRAINSDENKHERYKAR